MRKPELVGEFVEWYTGSDDPEDHAYCRVLVRADMPIELEVELP